MWLQGCLGEGDQPACHACPPARLPARRHMLSCPPPCPPPRPQTHPAPPAQRSWTWSAGSAWCWGPSWAVGVLKGRERAFCTSGPGSCGAWPGGGATWPPRPGSPRTPGRRKSHTAAGSCAGCAWRQTVSWSWGRGGGGGQRLAGGALARTLLGPRLGRLPVRSATAGKKACSAPQSLPGGRPAHPRARHWQSGSRAPAGLSGSGSHGRGASVPPPSLAQRRGLLGAVRDVALRAALLRGGERLGTEAAGRSGQRDSLVGPTSSRDARERLHLPWDLKKRKALAGSL